MTIFTRGEKLTPKDKDDFCREVSYINYYRVRNLSILVIVIAIVLLILIDLPNLQRGFNVVGTEYQVLFYLHASLGLSMLFFFSLSWGKLRFQSPKITWQDKLFDFSFGFTLAMICALFSVNDQRIDGEITLYILGLFVVTIINYHHPIRSLSIYLSSYIVFLAGITKLQSNALLLRGYYVNSAILIIIAWFMSNILYYAKEKDFIARRTIETQKSQLEHANNELTLANHALHESLEALDESKNMIFSLALALESKDEYIRGHSERVAEYAVALAKYLGLTEKEKQSLRYAAILHDTGKIGIPDVILNKSSKLSDEEWEIMKSHPGRGEKICSKLKFAQELLPVIRHHHEKFDGTGYPDGLKGENIPYLARIVAIADMVDAVTSQRPYRTAQTLEKALEELEINAGIQFDPDLALAFVKMYRQSSSDMLANS